MKSYGISLPREETNEPELIRYIRDWTYPTRLVDPSDGSPTSAVNWNIQDSIDKDRFFKEPGFLFGVQVFRPKVYLGNYEGSLTAYLKSGLSWLPGEALNSLAYGFREFAAASGPLPDASSAYVIDLRDLLQYGEQFVNFDLATSGKNIVALPNAGLTKKRYVSSTDVQSLFTGTDYHIETDGRLSLRIASRLGTDLSPSLE